MRYVYILLAIIVGAFFPVQASINAKLSSFLKTPLMAAFVNFMIGAIALLFIVIGTKTQNNILSAIKEAPPYAWIGGIIGATCVSSIIFFIPRLGAALCFGLIVAGQMIFSTIIDHYGWFGVSVQTISWPRIIGIIFILAGILLIQKY